MLFNIGIISTVLLIFFAILYSLLGYNTVFRDSLTEYLTEKAGTALMKDEKELLGERFLVPRQDRRSVRVNLYRYNGEDPSPVLFYAHGGNFLSGDADLDDAFCRKISQEWKVSVVSVNYSKIKAHVTSYPQEEIRDAVLYFQSHAEEYRFDKKRILMMGREAGAYLSLLAAVMLVSRAVVPAGLIFADPFIDYVAVSLAVAGMHPGPAALAVTKMTDKIDEYEEELDRGGVYVKMKVASEPDIPYEENEALLKWTGERIDDFLWR